MYVLSSTNKNDKFKYYQVLSLGVEKRGKVFIVQLLLIPILFVLMESFQVFIILYSCSYKVVWCC